MILRKFFLLVPFLLLPLCSKADPAIWLRLQGSNTVGAKLAPALAKQFLEQRGVSQISIKPTAVDNEFIVSGVEKGTQREVGITVAAHGTATGFQSLLNGSADVAMASRPIKPEENEPLSAQFGDMRSENAEHSLAIDGLAILVNASNPIGELSREQIAGLFSGAIRNWKDIGGADMPATEDYLLTRRLFLYTPPNLASAMVNDFVAFCMSRSGQKIVAEVGFVSQDIDEIARGDFSTAPAKYAEIAQTASRLSVNFRFKDGSAQLDNKALRDIDRLSEYLNAAGNANKKVYLMGFSTFEKNEKRDYVLSRFRALAVRAALMKKGIDVFELQGMGAAMPLASNSEIAQIKNNRVEVWLQ